MHSYKAIHTVLLSIKLIQTQPIQIISTSSLSCIGTLYFILIVTACRHTLLLLLLAAKTNTSNALKLRIFAQGRSLRRLKDYSCMLSLARDAHVNIRYANAASRN